MYFLNLGMKGLNLYCLGLLTQQLPILSSRWHMIAAEHRRRSQTNFVKWIEIARRISDFSHVTGDAQLQRRPEVGLVHPNRNTCSLFLLSTRSAPELHAPRLSLSWPSHRSTTWPVTLACAHSLHETVSGRVFGRISRAGLSVMRRSTSLPLDNY